MFYYFPMECRRWASTCSCGWFPGFLVFFNGYFDGRWIDGLGLGDPVDVGLRVSNPSLR